MGDIVPLPESPLHPKRAMERIRALWKDGSIMWTRHAEMVMRTRGVETTDVQHIIRYGMVTEHSRGRHLWRYQIEGTCVDGNPAACSVEINGLLVIVTVFLR